MGLVADSNQLCADASLVTFPSNAPFQDVVNAQFPADLADGFVRVLVGHGRSASDDAKLLRADLSQVSNRFFGQSVAEVLLRRVVAQILKRKNGQHDSLARRGTRGGTTSREVHGEGNDDQKKTCYCEGRRLPGPASGGRDARFVAGREVCERVLFQVLWRSFSRIRRRVCNVAHRSNEAVASPWQSLNEARIVGRIAEEKAQLSNGSVQAFIKTHVGIGWPKSR